MEEVQKNENGTTVPQTDGKPEKEKKPKRELTPQQVQQRRKMIVFPLMFLADKTAFNYYKDLAEKGYYNRVISGNVTQTVEIDSVKCDFDQYPYKVNTYARQLIVRESSLTVRSLVTSCRLLNATRSDNNPHGFIIEAFTITENKDLQTVKR